MIKVKNLVFKYKRSNYNVIDDMSFDIKDNTINVILGLNGCGKTTLIRLLVGLEKKQSGEIIINDKNIDDLSILERSKEISYVSQINSHNSEVNVYDYLTFGMSNKLKFYESPDEKIKAKVLENVEKFNIEKLLDKNLGEISGGERQLVAICSALIQDSKIIILDEPTSALDVKNQAMVLQTLNNISKENNKTIIFTTHNPNQALKLNANVIVMNDGKVYNQGSAKDIITKEKLASVFGEGLVYSKDLDYDEVSYEL